MHMAMVVTMSMAVMSMFMAVVLVLHVGLPCQHSQAMLMPVLMTDLGM